MLYNNINVSVCRPDCPFVVRNNSGGVYIIERLLILFPPWPCLFLPLEAIKQYIIGLNSVELCGSNQILSFGTTKRVKSSKKFFSLFQTFGIARWHRRILRTVVAQVKLILSQSQDVRTYGNSPLCSVLQDIGPLGPLPKKEDFFFSPTLSSLNCSQIFQKIDEHMRIAPLLSS